ncbi:MAG: hypothetical protein M1836_003173 [Candelina mexicana]|nr:MAG: hypothetical protein M1836_003173 [Candelina mexicana]
MATAAANSVKASLEATKVGYKQLGKNGLRVSIPILGAMGMGDPQWAPWVLSEDKWDTANVYSNGVSETVIGNTVKKFNIPRHKLVILTKCCGVVGEEPGISVMQGGMRESKDYINNFGLSRQGIFTAVNASLHRLQMDYIDLLQIHRFDATVPIEETMEALHDLVKSGKVRYIGASSMWTYQFALMQFTAEKHGWTKFVSMQNHYSLLYREEEREMNKFCNATGVGLIPWSPLARGHLARPPSDLGKSIRSKDEMENPMFPKTVEADHQIIGRVQELAEKKGWKMGTVALAWICGRVSSPIVGFNSIERIDEALEIRGKSLTDEEVKYLEEPYQPKPIVGHN